MNKVVVKTKDLPVFKVTPKEFKILLDAKNKEKTLECHLCIMVNDVAKYDEPSRSTLLAKITSSLNNYKTLSAYLEECEGYPWGSVRGQGSKKARSLRLRWINKLLKYNAEVVG